MSPKLADILERGLWTVAQAAVGFGASEIGNLSYWWAIPFAGVLSVLKNLAITLPSQAAPVAPAADPEAGK